MTSPVFWLIVALLVVVAGYVGDSDAAWVGSIIALATSSVLQKMEDASNTD